MPRNKSLTKLKTETFVKKNLTKYVCTFCFVKYRKFNRENNLNLTSTLSDSILIRIPVRVFRLTKKKGLMKRVLPVLTFINF